jgi:predicted O-linked N-acetylglucosamine transferase (SPINDLY family)
LLKGRPFADRKTRALIEKRLRARGIAIDRIALEGHTTDDTEHLAQYHRLDIALDPFPYNGTATTCEALWMGVPVVTLAGDRHGSRVGASLLESLGLRDWVATDASTYVDIAAAHAADLARLESLRARLRERMAGSPLCDATAFARKVEAAYRTMWRAWVAAA